MLMYTWGKDTSTMAANNYFGFTHGGTQYSAQPTSAYPAAQTAYVQPAHQTAYAAAAAPRAAQTYDSYQTTPAPGQYAYATRTQPTATYDTSKAYYAPPTAAPTGTATAVYTVAETPYQTAFTPAAKPAYSSPSYTSAAAQPRQTTTAKTQNTAPASATNYVYQSATTTAPASSTFVASTTTANSFTGSYDAALYSAATTYYQQQQAAKTGTTWQYKKGQQTNKPKQKQPPKPPQLHYCEVCKISCAGPQTYREHLEGQKHKKKEAALKTGGTAATGRGQNQLRCELCDVSCTGADAYAAHIRGAKHQKVLKLHTKLGKPIPSTDPVVVSSNSGATSTSSGKMTVASSANAKPVAKPVTTVTQTTAPKKIMSTPKITFIGGSTLKTTGGKTEEIKSNEQKQAELAAQILQEDKEDAKLALVTGDKDVQPVGQEYIEEVKNEAGKTVSFNCKLCECKFNDPNAKEMHMKGRRHRLQYKKKVDPSLQVEVKPSIRARKLQEEKLRRQAAKEDYWRRRDAEERWREEMRMEEEQYYMGRGFAGRGGMPPFGLGMSGPGGPGPMGGMPVRRPDTADDRHVMAKHASIYPNETELQAVQNIVSSCEKALKLVSDFIADIDAPKPSEPEKVTKEEEKKSEPESDGESKKDEPSAPPRALKGVMRVGVLAKGLLLHNDLNVQLVLLCSEKPTRTQLERIADSLPKHLSGISEDTFDVKISVEEAAVVVTSEKEPKTTCSITLTSPVMREEYDVASGESVTAKGPPDVLDRQKCLDALAALRHAKWFQARANGLQSCVVVIRILRDLCQRVPTWTPLNQWAMELLVEKCVSGGGANMSPGDALRRVFECIASGILLPGGPGLYDPCEKNPKDAAASLANQEREDITASAQHALRLIAFRHIHKVLGMDPLPLPRFRAGHRSSSHSRKRRRTNSTGDGGDGDGVDGKKDKKDDGNGTEATDSSQ